LAENGLGWIKELEIDAKYGMSVRTDQNGMNEFVKKALMGFFGFVGT
jgi:ATP-dependent Clp protease adapter protein ClpS